MSSCHKYSTRYWMQQSPLKKMVQTSTRFYHITEKQSIYTAFTMLLINLSPFLPVASAYSPIVLSKHIEQTLWIYVSIFTRTLMPRVKITEVNTNRMFILILQLQSIISFKYP